MTLVNIIKKQKEKKKKETDNGKRKAIKTQKERARRSTDQWRRQLQERKGSKGQATLGLKHVPSLTMLARDCNPNWSWGNRVVGSDGVEKRAHSDVYLLWTLWDQFQCLNILTVGNNGRVSRNSKIYYLKFREIIRVWSCQVWSWQGSVVWTRREFLIPSDTVLSGNCACCNRCHCIIG